MLKIRKIMTLLVLLFLVTLIGATLYLGLTDTDIATQATSIEIPNDRFFK